MRRVGAVDPTCCGGSADKLESKFVIEGAEITEMLGSTDVLLAEHCGVADKDEDVVAFPVQGAGKDEPEKLTDPRGEGSERLGGMPREELVRI